MTEGLGHAHASRNAGKCLVCTNGMTTLVCRKFTYALLKGDHVATKTEHKENRQTRYEILTSGNLNKMRDLNKSYLFPEMIFIDKIKGFLSSSISRLKTAMSIHIPSTFKPIFSRHSFSHCSCFIRLQ